MNALEDIFRGHEDRSIVNQCMIISFCKNHMPCPNICLSLIYNLNKTTPPGFNPKRRKKIVKYEHSVIRERPCEEFKVRQQLIMQ